MGISWQKRQAIQNKKASANRTKLKKKPKGYSRGQGRGSGPVPEDVLLKRKGDTRFQEARAKLVRKKFNKPHTKTATNTSASD